MKRKKCQHCGRLVGLKGLFNHEQACVRNGKQKEQKNMHYHTQHTCPVCSKVSKGNTFFVHFKRMHPKEYEEYQRTKRLLETRKNGNIRLKESAVAQDLRTQLETMLNKYTAVLEGATIVAGGYTITITQEKVA